MINIQLLNKQLNDKNLTIYQLYHLVNIPERTIYQIFNGTVKNPRIDNIYKICKELDLTLDQVYVEER